MSIDLKRSLRSLPVVKQALEKKVVVVAIDFGTTYSGYAFSFQSDFLTDPLKIHAPTWQKGKRVGIVHETSSCALFNPEQEFDSFGYEAEDRYGQLASQSNHYNWYYFRHFKMVLYNTKDLSKNLELVDDKGNTMPAIDVFAKSIEYLKEHFMGEFNNTKDEHPIQVNEDEIHWVLTVPAIWSDGAKQFMREAAVHGGIHRDRLSIALEPEAASLFCRYIPVQRVVGDSGTDIKGFSAGDKYLILDAGGGTIDITVHEIQDDDTVKELHSANGGEWGGTTIDKKFEELLDDIIGPDTMEIIRLRYKEDHLELLGNFETKKRIIAPDTTDKVTIRVPLSVSEEYKSLNGGEELKAGGRLPAYLKDSVAIDADKIRLEADVMKGLYGETCEVIVNHVRQIFDESAVRDVNRILMVGGFSESKMLQDAIKRAFPGKIVIVPEEAGLAVLKGAVTFGQCPTLITSRVCRHTYGIRAIRDFQPGLDRPERRIVKTYGKTKYFLCGNTFSIHATRGESIDVGESRGKHEYVPSEPGEKKLTVSVFRSTRRMPVYTDEDSSEWVGDVPVNLQDSVDGVDRPVTVEMVFGDTELKVKLVEKRTGHTEEGLFNCLRDESHV